MKVVRVMKYSAPSQLLVDDRFYQLCSDFEVRLRIKLLLRVGFHLRIIIKFLNS